MNQSRQPALTTREWAEVRALFERCLALPPNERELVIARETRGREWLRREVESLLEKERVAEGSFLGPPLLERIAESDSPPPDALGKYQILHRLGRGGMAEVFLARALGPRGFERLVALKRILPDYAHDPQLREFFEFEAKLSSRLNHANIVHLYDFGIEGNEFLLAMELVHGVNLAEVMRRARAEGVLIPRDVALYLCARVADALDYAHRRRDDVTGEPLGIIHRDVSPKNIMISFEGDVKVVDFGIARAEGRAATTRTGGLRGTVGYLSPEGAAGERVDARADVFSLSVILYELLSGGRLFEADDVFAILNQLREGRVVGRKLDGLEADEGLKDILRKGLALDRNARTATAGDLRRELDEHLAGNFPPNPHERLSRWMLEWFAGERAERRALLAAFPSRPSGPGESSPTGKPARAPRKRVAWILGLLLLAGLAAIFLKPPPPEPGPVARDLFDRLCAKDREKFCSGMDLGKGLLQCLQRASGLSPACKSLVDHPPPPFL